MPDAGFGFGFGAGSFYDPLVIDEGGAGPMDWNDLTGSMRTGLTPAAPRPNPFDSHMSSVMASPLTSTAAKLETVPEAQADAAKSDKLDVIPCQKIWWVCPNVPARHAHGLSGTRSGSGLTTKMAPLIWTSCVTSSTSRLSAPSLGPWWTSATLRRRSIGRSRPRRRLCERPFVDGRALYCMNAFRSVGLWQSFQ